MNQQDFICETMQGASNIALLAIMCAISQEHWCAGWMAGLETRLWKIEVGTQYGMSVITENEATLLRILSEEAGGWWSWGDEDGDNAQFLKTSDWLARLERTR